MSDKYREGEEYVVRTDPGSGRPIAEGEVVRTDPGSGRPIVEDVQYVERPVVERQVVEQPVLERPVIERTEEVYRETEAVAGPNIIGRIIGVIVWVVSVLLVIRIVFKLLGANADNVFSNAIYSVTQPLVGIFEGIFPNQNAAEVGGFLELSAVIALVIVILIGIALRMLFASSRARHVTKVHRD